MSVKALPLQGENLKLVGWEGKPALVDTPDCLLDSVKSVRGFQYCQTPQNIDQVRVAR